MLRVFTTYLNRPHAHLHVNSFCLMWGVGVGVGWYKAFTCTNQEHALLQLLLTSNRWHTPTQEEGRSSDRWVISQVYELQYSLIVCVCVYYLCFRVFELLHFFLDFHLKHLLHLHLHLLHLSHVLSPLFLHLGQRTPAHGAHERARTPAQTHLSLVQLRTTLCHLHQSTHPCADVLWTVILPITMIRILSYSNRTVKYWIFWFYFLVDLTKVSTFLSYSANWKLISATPPEGVCKQTGLQFFTEEETDGARVVGGGLEKKGFWLFTVECNSRGRTPENMPTGSQIIWTGRLTQPPHDRIQEGCEKKQETKTNHRTFLGIRRRGAKSLMQGTCEHWWSVQVVS